MAWIVDNWMVLVGLAAIGGAAGAAIWRFIQQGKAKQLENVKEWLLWAVTEAERTFDAGTGRLKLRYVYDYFLSTFPWLGKAVSFQNFSDLVDDALASMKGNVAEQRTGEKLCKWDNHHGRNTDANHSDKRIY